MRINGEEVKLDNIITLKSLLERLGYDVSRVAVEKNGAIVPKSQFESETVRSGDCLEIVSFVGGG